MCLVDWLSDPPPQRPHWPFYTPPPISDPPVHATPRPLQSLCWPLAPVVHAGTHNGHKGKAWTGRHTGLLCALKGSGQDEPHVAPAAAVPDWGGGAPLPKGRALGPNSARGAGGCTMHSAPKARHWRLDGTWRTGPRPRGGHQVIIRSLVRAARPCPPPPTSPTPPYE